MKISTKYSNLLDIFSLDSAAEMLKYTKINDHPINLLEDKKLPYSLVYSLEPVELKTLKTYIEANLASSFIGSFKSSTSILILFV